MNSIVALYVATDGCYFGLPAVDTWDEARDARKCNSRLPAVAHPPCQRWGNYWHGSPSKPHRFKLGDDGGCFKHAITYIPANGGVIEHPMNSRAWDAFNIAKPPMNGGWIATGDGGWTCCVYQGHYGHIAGKGTWLVVYGLPRAFLPELIWGKCEQRLPSTMVAKHGAKKASRIGMMAMLSSKDKRRNATPIPFRSVLLSIARSIPQ